jgi:hypothetical protein
VKLVLWGLYMIAEKHLVGMAEVEDKRLLRIEILGYNYYISREDLVQLLHGYRTRISVYENAS